MPPPNPDPPCIEHRIAEAATWYHLEPFQVYQLQMEFQKYSQKWFNWNKPSYPEAIYYAENKIILSIIKQIKTSENEMDQLIFQDLQEAPGRKIMIHQ